jgi:hypothetical protein
MCLPPNNIKSRNREKPVLQSRLLNKPDEKETHISKRALPVQSREIVPTDAQRQRHFARIASVAAGR